MCSRFRIAFIIYRKDYIDPIKYKYICKGLINKWEKLSSTGLTLLSSMILFTSFVILHPNIDAGVIPKVMPRFPIQNFAEHCETFVIPIQSFVIILS